MQSQHPKALGELGGVTAHQASHGRGCSFPPLSRERTAAPKRLRWGRFSLQGQAKTPAPAGLGFSCLFDWLPLFFHPEGFLE